MGVDEDFNILDFMYLKINEKPHQQQEGLCRVEFDKGYVHQVLIVD